LVLFLDDLQWAEPASIELCAALVADAAIPGLMVLGACRGDEVAIEQHLAVTLRELEADRVLITNLEVGNMSQEALQNLLLDTFQLSEESGVAVASLVHLHTDGNIFFAMEFLESLQKTGLLTSDGLKWKWEPNDIVLSTLHYDDVVDLVSHKIQQLTLYEREVIKIASCLGCEFDDTLICDIVKSGEVSSALDVAEMNGLIVKQSNSCGYRFRHDRIQQAASSMIPDEQKAAFHLSIGRALLQALSSDDIYANIFLIVNLLQVGVELIETEEEKVSMATLCLRAGEKASVSSAFLVALRYLNLGLAILGDSRWRFNYNLTLILTNAAAEVAYCNADYEHMDALTNSVLSQAHCFDDKVRAFTTQIYSLGSRHRLQQAIDLGLEVLRELGEPFPKKIRRFYTRWTLIKTNRMLRNKTTDDILNLPRLRNPNKLAAVRIMNLLFPFCLDGRVELAPLLGMRVVQITMETGICGM
jgi:predicted ATPase